MRLGISVLLALLILCLIPESILAAGSEDGGWGWLETIGRWINLSVLFGAIIYFVRKPVKKFFSDRREQIQVEIDEAKKARDEAEAKLISMEERMKKLDDELAELREQAEAEAKQEYDRISFAAELEAKKIVASAESEIVGLTKAAREELKAYASELSVDLAKDRIRGQLDSKTRGKIVDRFFVKLATGKGEKS